MLTPACRITSMYKPIFCRACAVKGFGPQFLKNRVEENSTTKIPLFRDFSKLSASQWIFVLTLFLEQMAVDESAAPQRSDAPIHIKIGSRVWKIGDQDFSAIA
jgi:hypothetical protein